MRHLGSRFLQEFLEQEFGILIPEDLNRIPEFRPWIPAQHVYRNSNPDFPARPQCFFRSYVSFGNPAGDTQNSYEVSCPRDVRVAQAIERNLQLKKAVVDYSFDPFNSIPRRNCTRNQEN